MFTAKTVSVRPKSNFSEENLKNIKNPVDKSLIR